MTKADASRSGMTSPVGGAAFAFGTATQSASVSFALRLGNAV